MTSSPGSARDEAVLAQIGGKGGAQAGEPATVGVSSALWVGGDLTDTLHDRRRRGVGRRTLRHVEHAVQGTALEEAVHVTDRWVDLVECPPHQTHNVLQSSACANRPAPSVGVHNGPRHRPEVNRLDSVSARRRRRRT
jgi:hypothetical protein